MPIHEIEMLGRPYIQITDTKGNRHCVDPEVALYVYEHKESTFIESIEVDETFDQVIEILKGIG